MRDACTDLGSLAGVCINPLNGSEARSLPRNSYSLGLSFHQSFCGLRNTSMMRIHLTLA